MQKSWKRIFWKKNSKRNFQIFNFLQKEFLSQRIFHINDYKTFFIFNNFYYVFYKLNLIMIFFFPHFYWILIVFFFFILFDFFFCGKKCECVCELLNFFFFCVSCECPLIVLLLFLPLYSYLQMKWYLILLFFILLHCNNKAFLYRTLNFENFSFLLIFYSFKSFSFSIIHVW